MRFIRSRFTSAHLIALIALFVALGGSAYAIHLGKNAVKAKNIKNGAVIESKIADSAVTGGKIAPGAVGAANLQNVAVRSITFTVNDDSNQLGSAKCAPNELPLGGAAQPNTGNSADVVVVGTNFVHANGGPVSNGTSIGKGGGFQANIANYPGGTSPGQITGLVYVLCLQ